jgi:phosphoribosylformylglycinamidine synthase
MRGYHKPIMIAGGLGNIRRARLQEPSSAGTPADPARRPRHADRPRRRRGSSMATGTNTADLDFASVQRGNPEIQRRAQEVIDRCWQLGDDNPILAIHDVGAGGLSNAMPELAHDAGCGAAFDLRASQRRAGHEPARDLVQRGAGALRAGHRPGAPGRVPRLCERERCPFAVLGVATATASSR